MTEVPRWMRGFKKLKIKKINSEWIRKDRESLVENLSANSEWKKLQVTVVSGQERSDPLGWWVVREMAKYCVVEEECRESSDRWLPGRADDWRWSPVSDRRRRQARQTWLRSGQFQGELTNDKNGDSQLGMKGNEGSKTEKTNTNKANR